MNNVVDIDGQRRKAASTLHPARELEQTLHGGGPGGTSGDMKTEDPLKARVDFLHTAFLGLLGLIVAGFIGLATLIGTSNNAANSRIDKAGETVSALNREVGVVGGKVDESNRRLDRIDGKLDQISAKLDKR
jgi:hypothetical protein